MIRFTSISIKNFMSYGSVPTNIILDRPGTTLVLGEDLDNSSSGTGSNGVGKTSLINALTYAIYDKPLSNISKDNLVNNINKKNMMVILDFDKDGKSYRIERARKTKAGAAGNHVHLYEDGKDITPDSVSNTNSTIERIIGIPYELFIRIVTFSANNIPFLDLPVRSHVGANQTDIIEELFDLKTLSEKAVLLKEHIKDTESSLSTHLTRIEQIERELKRHEAQVDSAKRRVLQWETQNAAEITNLRSKLSKLDNVDIEQQQLLHQEMNRVDGELGKALEEQRSTEKQIKEITKAVKKATNELSHLENDQCPYCLQHYTDASDKKSELQVQINQYNSKLADLGVELKECDEDVERLACEHKTISNQILVSDINELVDIKGQQSQIRSKIADMEAATNPYLEALDELLELELDAPSYDKVNELKDLLDHQKFLLKLLTKKDSFVRKALLNKNIPFLNQRLAHYLSELGLPHTVEFTHEMTASISQFGRELDFGNLSNGQRARVNLALSFAFRDVLQSLHDYINICMLDEVLDVGLDGVGIQAAARMLKRKSRDEGISIYLISHRDEIDSTFNNKMIIQMSKGFSYVRFEE